ncbi:MAG: bifunctional nuclease domain-containing protein [bacterium]
MEGLRRPVRVDAARALWRAAPALLLLVAACERSADRGVPVRVRRVAFDPASQVPVVLLEDTEHALALPIWLGPAEAQAIASHLDGPAPARPLTHDLMKTVFERLGVDLRRVVIRSLEGSIYFADLVLERDGEELTVDSRPSDAIALAVRYGQPIFVERALFQREAVIDLHGADADDVLAVDGLTVQAFSADLAGVFDLPPGHGVLISDVAEGAGNGLQRGDVVLELDGAPIHDAADFRARLRGGAGTAALTVRRGGESLVVWLDRHVATD